MAIAPDNQGKAPALRCKRRLEEAFQVPALHKHDIKPASPKAPADLGRVAAREPVQRRRICYIAQKLMSVSGEQGDIPVEAHAEPGLCLIGCRRTMGEEDD